MQADGNLHFIFGLVMSWYVLLAIFFMEVIESEHQIAMMIAYGAFVGAGILLLVSGVKNQKKSPAMYGSGTYEYTEGVPPPEPAHTVAALKSAITADLPDGTSDS